MSAYSCPATTPFDQLVWYGQQGLVEEMDSILKANEQFDINAWAPEGGHTILFDLCKAHPQRFDTDAVIKGAQWLVKVAGADPNKLNEYNGRNPLYAAEKYENEALVTALKELGATEPEEGFDDDDVTKDPPEDIFKAAEDERWASLIKLLDEGADIKALSDNNCSILQYLVADDGGPKKQALIQRVLDAGVDVNHVDDDGDDALYEAVYRGANRNVKTLLAAGADPKVRTNPDPELVVAIHGDGELDSETFQLLVEAGIPLTQYNEDDETVLHVVAQRKKPKESIEPNIRCLVKQCNELLFLKTKDDNELVPYQMAETDTAWTTLMGLGGAPMEAPTLQAAIACAVGNFELANKLSNEAEEGTFDLCKEVPRIADEDYDEDSPEETSSDAVTWWISFAKPEYSREGFAWFLERGLKPDTRVSDMNLLTVFYQMKLDGAAQLFVERFPELLKGSDFVGEEDDVPVLGALKKRCWNTAKALIDAGVSLDCQLKKGNGTSVSPLSLAIAKGAPFDVLERILSSPTVDKNEKDRDGNPLLSSMIGNKQFDAAKALVEAGAAVDWLFRGDYGVKSDIFSLSFANEAPTEFIASILALPAIKINGPNGNDSDSSSEEEEEGEEGEKLPITPLMMASNYSNVDTIKLLIEKGADVNALGPDGDTALACSLGSNTEKANLEIARVLLDAGAKADVIDDGKRNALHHLAASDIDKDGSLVDPLVAAGADPAAKDRYDLTPLEIMYRSGCRTGPLYEALKRVCPEIEESSDEESD